MLDVFLVQMDSATPEVDNCKARNFGKVRSLVQGVIPAGVKNGLIVLPEMFATGYIPKNPSDYAEDFENNESETPHFLQQLADETGCIVVGAGIHKPQNDTKQKNATKLRNRSATFFPGKNKAQACYDKSHNFFPELSEFEAGEGINLFKINEWNVGVAICYDLRFPELFRDAVKKGAQLIVIEAAWPKIRVDHWETLLKARAIENQVYIAAVNAVTAEENEIHESLPLGGNSMLISPQGQVIAKGNQNREEIVSGTLNLTLLNDYRKTFPVLNGIVQNGMI